MSTNKKKKTPKRERQQYQHKEVRKKPQKEKVVGKKAHPNKKGKK